MNAFIKIAAMPGAKVSRAGDQIQCLCPAHDDRNPSLTVSLKDGKILLKCHAGCSQDAVIKAFMEQGVNINEVHASVGAVGLVYSPVKRGGAMPNFRHLYGSDPDDVWTYYDQTGEMVLGYIARWEVDIDG